MLVAAADTLLHRRDTEFTAALEILSLSQSLLNANQQLVSRQRRAKIGELRGCGSVRNFSKIPSFPT